MLNKVLVFESDTAFAGELRTQLANLGCSATVVDDGNAGLQQAAADRPDLILLAIELPRMNGFSVCNRLKKDASLKDVPLIIMSSESSDETFDQHRKLRTRAEDYVHKPIAFGQLLEHIQKLVPLGTGPGSTDGSILIDDEIEVGSADYLIDEDAIIEEDSGIHHQPPFQPAPSAALPTDSDSGNLDTDVDALAESAFGRLTHLEGDDGSQPGPNGSAADPLSAPVAASVPQPAPPFTRSPVALSADAARAQLVEQELAGTRGRLEATEHELNEARRELARLRLEAGDAARLTREVEEVRAKLAAAAKTGGTASREFLDLREALHKKDKEILALKQQLSAKDREIVDAQERALSTERATADVEERLLGVERELAAAGERSEALAAERDAATRAQEEAASRLERAKSDADGREQELADLRARHADERAAHEMKVAALRGELDQLLATEREAHARAAEQAEQRRLTELEQAARAHDAAIEEARAQAQAHLDALRAQHEADLRAHEEEADRRVTEIESRATQELEDAGARAADLEAQAAKAADQARSAVQAQHLAEQAHQEAQKTVADLHAEAEDLRRRVAAAHAKRDTDRRSLERAKDALAVALAQIEETESPGEPAA